MKKIFALVVTLAMLLSMAVIMPMAADVEGDWTVYRQANDYHEIDPDTGEEPSYRPAPGYHYTDEGFSTIPADYTGTSPYFNVQTKDKHNVKDGLYLKFRVDEFAYKGEDGRSDEWIALSLWTKQNLAPGTTDHGSGWISLVRGLGDGSEVEIGNTICRETSESQKGVWKGYDSSSGTPEVDEQGREIYTLSVRYVNDQYEISVCGVLLPNSDIVTKYLNQFSETGDFYVGVSFMSTAKDGKASMTILEYGSSESDAIMPVGSDSKQPEVNNNVVADMMDASNIGENQPGVYWDASLYTPSGQNLEFMPMGNNAFKVTALESAGLFNWSVRKDISYAAEDFPVFAMMVKDFWYKGTLWYFAGDIISTHHDYRLSFSAFDGIYYEEEEFADYTLICIDLTDMWSGRINGVRVDLTSIEMTTPEFEICYMGCFRSVEEAESYGNTYLGRDASAVESSESTEAPTDPSDESGNVVTDPQESKPVENEDPTTSLPPENGDSEKVTSDATTEKIDDAGCSSVIGTGFVMLLALAACLVIKKKRD